MAIERTVETDVYCDVCGEWIMGWKSNDTGVSRAWAAEYTRRRGGTVGKKIVCKKCRIKERIRTCSLQRKIGNAGRDSDGTCMGVVVKHFCNTLFENSPGISSFKWCFPIIVGMRTDMIVPYVHISV